MDTVKQIPIYFGGSYQEFWSYDGRLRIDYSERKFVLAEFSDGGFHVVGGDKELSALLNSSDCPALMRRYFETAAKAASAVMKCAQEALPFTALSEFITFKDEPMAVCELMRILMDEHGMSMESAYEACSLCCANLKTDSLDAEELFPLQPRTAALALQLSDKAAQTPAACHDTRKSEYRSGGAMRCGEKLTLRFKLISGEVYAAYFVLHSSAGSTEHPMERKGDIFACEYTLPEKAEAMWYSFRLETSQGPRWLCPDGSGWRGRLYWHEQSAFRLTVFEADFDTPAWFRRSVMYQIFPDRFAFSDDGTAERGVEYHRALGQTAELHASLDEPVRYLPREFEKDYIPDDFYGGTLRGIINKLHYLQKLGVSCLYLNPIVEARSNHRYDASDYMRVDPVLGTNEDFSLLCCEAEKFGMRVILDGVFSHTGADSIYFNRFGSYDSIGACQGEQSPYYDWYDFKSFPNDYRSWWGFKELPEVNELDGSWQKYVISGNESVIKTWLRRGAAGWRLDVADELPDEVLSLIRRSAKEEKRDALILGEVWEDAVIKESYGKRRNYALGGALDSVMNYPLRSAIIDFAKGRSDAYTLRDFLTAQQLNYPAPLYYSLMNFLSTHDVPRLRTELAAGCSNIHGMSREAQLELCFCPEALDNAKELSKLCTALIFSLPGVPCIYYGDEQGMCGLGDPFNRLPFKEEDAELCDYFAELSARRGECDALSTGEARFYACGRDIIIVLRYIRGGHDVFSLDADDGAYLIVANRADKALPYFADLSGEGFGQYEGIIAAKSAAYIKIK